MVSPTPVLVNHLGGTAPSRENRGLLVPAILEKELQGE